MTPIYIIFPAVLGVNQFETQDVDLGASFPAVSITLLDVNTGLHEFRIEKHTPNMHPDMLNPIITEAKKQIEHFWTILAFIRDSTIRPTGEISYYINGQRHEVAKKYKNRAPTLSGIAGKEWFHANRAALTARYDLEKIKQLNFARGIEEPIGRFIALYQLLLTKYKDKQLDVDKAIIAIDSRVAQTKSPKNPKIMETTFTRLRNELAHFRADALLFETHEEINSNLHRFEWIVNKIMREDILES